MAILAAENSFRRGLMWYVDGYFDEAVTAFKTAMEIEKQHAVPRPQWRYLSYYGLSLARADRPTREAIDVPLSVDGQEFLLVDTAGLRRQSRSKEAVEFYSTLRSAKAIARAQVVLVLLDASEGVTQQDQRIAGMAEEAGKAASARRARLRQVIGFATDFYRRLLHRLAGAVGADDDDLSNSVERAAAEWTGDVPAAAACLERCLDAADQVDRNANQTTLLECWLDDLAKITATGRAPVQISRF